MVMVLSILYGHEDFSDTLNICNMCGWDTDCNVGNAGTIMGVFVGINGIDYDKWAKPINDFLACSNVIPSLNAVDIPFGASYFAKSDFYRLQSASDDWLCRYDRSRDCRCKIVVSFCV